MRKFRNSIAVLVCLLGAACDTNNYYGCAVDDGGACMGLTGDHWGDDELQEPSSSSANRSIFTPDSKLQDSNTIVQGRSPIALVEARVKGDVPQLVTVNLAAPAGLTPDPNSFVTIALAEPVAILEFGVGGTAYQIEVDYGVGVQFSLLVSRLRISAEYRMIPGAPVPAVPDQLVLAASIGEGVVAQPKSPTRTINPAYYGGLLGGGLAPLGNSGKIPIPLFAKSMTIVAISTAPPAPVAVNATIFGMQGTYQYVVPIIAVPSQEIPLTNDARYILLDNVGPSSIYAWRVIFNLAL